MTKASIEKFKGGYYAVITKHESNFTPAMFWVTSSGKVAFFSPDNSAPMIHPNNPDEIITHFENLEEEGFTVAICGY